MVEGRGREVSLFKSIDWLCIFLYIALLVCGWFSVCGASYDFGQTDFLSFDCRSGKQLVWMGLALAIGFIIMMLETKLYEMLANVVYGFMLLLLAVTIVIAPDVKGSHSWLVLGPVSLQPAEFAKFATALAVAKYMNTFSTPQLDWKTLLRSSFFVLTPMALIILQNETGSALVYLAFFLMFYREGMPGSLLFCALSAVLYFVIGVRYRQDMILGELTSAGEFAVLFMIQIFITVMIVVYTKSAEVFKIVGGVGVGGTIIAILFSAFAIPFNVAIVQIILLIVSVLFLAFYALRDRLFEYYFILAFAIGSMAFFYSSDYVLNNVMQPHQQSRIRVVLGLEEDLSGAGYNVNQAKIAIGSGGLTGKGFLNGTQTKLKYVPEQDTDFIFCTIGEEQGFVGSSIVIILYAFLIIRLVIMAERQIDRFGRVYGYCVLSIFLFHLFINIGMVLGLTPVIGIPLPFFSYGGSSLWGFTILLFIFLKIDSGRLSAMR